MYSSSKLAGDLARYLTVKSTNNLEETTVAMIKGVTISDDFTAEKQMGHLLRINGPDKQRIPLRDNNVTSIKAPVSHTDESTYIDSIIELVNRYLTSIRTRSSDNKIKSLIIKLFMVNLGGFYGNLKLPNQYNQIIECIFTDLYNANQELFRRLDEALRNKEYLMDKLPPRFEYTLSDRPLARDIYQEYIANLNCDLNGVDSNELGNFIREMDQDEDEIIDQSEYLMTLESVDEDYVYGTLKLMGYHKLLNSRLDKVLPKKYPDLDKKSLNQLKTILQKFKNVHLKLTRTITLNLYCELFKLSTNTYRDNKVVIVREISDIANSEEFTNFSELFLPQ